jgi:hypothetical protein
LRFATAVLVALAAAAAPAEARAAVPCAERIAFSGFDWIVSDAAERFPGAAPGFSWSRCNVRVRSLPDGTEVLTLTLRKEQSGWRGAQLTTRDTYRYGTFSMAIESSLRGMLIDSPSAVLGFFAYLGPAYTNEIDVEFTRWGIVRSPAMHYTVWPDTSMGDTPLPANASGTGDPAEFAAPAIHRFIWTNRSVAFQSISIPTSMHLGHAFKVTSNVPTKPMHIMLNFWVEPHANMGAATTYEVNITSVTRTLP